MDYHSIRYPAGAFQGDHAPSVHLDLVFQQAAIGAAGYRRILIRKVAESHGFGKGISNIAEADVSR